MCFIRCKHRTRKEDAETAKGNSEILSMMMKYIMSMSGKDCKCQQEKRETFRECFYPSSNPFLHSHSSPVYCWQGDICEVEKYTGTCIKSDNRQNMLAVVPFKNCTNKSLRN